MAQIQIYVYTPALDLVGIVEDYESASITRSFYEAGQWSITINYNIPNASLLQKGYYVQFGEDPRDAGKITTVNQKIDEGGKGSQVLVVSGLDLKAMFAQRTIMQLNDIDQFYLSDDAETVIKTLISDQCGATCTDANRVLPNLVIAANQGRGGTYTISTKYTQLYAECATAATQSLLGWFVYIDHVNKTFVMDCEVGLDRSAAQSVNPLCLFSPDMDSLKSASFVDDISTYRNLVYVGGDGQGASRVIHIGYDTTEPTGFNRYEMFDDASNVSTTAALTAEAQAVLKQYNQTYELEGDVLVMSPYVYKEQYNVGDICTVKFSDVNLNVRILDITQSWEWGEYTISSTWGKPINTLAGQISALSTGAASKGTGSEVGTNVSGMKNGIYQYNLSSANATMQGNECIYNNIELTGTLTADRTFTFYLDAVRQYGRKVYRVLISAKSNGAANRTITLTAGSGTDVQIDVASDSITDLHSIMVDSLGNVIAAKYEYELPLKATQFPGICAQCALSENDISINYTTRVLTITPPLGYFDFFVDGNGKIKRFKKIGNVSFPAFTDTSGIWFFHFDVNGNAVSTQTPWASFDIVAPVYRLLWNATLTGDARSTVEAFECHLNDISGIDHAWKHTVGTIWRSGGQIVNNLIATGTPNADGRNTVISITDLSCLDDNLPYTVTNSAGGLKFQQNMGNISAGALNATNSGLFKVRFQTAASLVNTLAATRFPFAWAAATNRPEIINTTGTRVLVDNLNFFVYFVYVIQDPRNGDAVRVVSDPNQFTGLTAAQASSWASIQSVYSTLNDSEIRPLYKLTFEYKQTWNAGCKYSVLREVADIRKQQIAQLSLSAGSLAASSVTFVPGTSGLASTNAQALGIELANPVTTKTSIVDTDTVTGNDSEDIGKVKKWTWTTIKAFLKTYFDTFYASFGTYTPTATSAINLDAYNLSLAIWRRTGDIVTVSGFCNINLIAGSTSSSITITLPVASDLVSFLDITGQAVSGVASGSWIIVGDPDNNVAKFETSNISSTAETAYTYSFCYKVM
jgi:hypothetical protein